MFHNRYIILSLLFHSVFILCLVSGYPSCGKDKPSQIIEVSIVNNITPEGMDRSEHGPLRWGKTFPATQPSRNISLEEVERERPVNDPDAELPRPETDRDSPDREGRAEYALSTDGGGHITGWTPHEIDRWKSAIQGIVQSCLHDPDENADPRLKATCLLMVNRTGELLKGQLIESSGNDLFDTLVQESLRKISHLPPPPAVMTAGAESIDVTLSFTFPLHDRN